MQLVLRILPILIALTFYATDSSAQRRVRRATAPSESSTHLTYDIGASTGTYNGFSYSEITLGFNWFFMGHGANTLAWRNAIFNRFGSQSENVLGVDSSLRYAYESPAEGGDLGYTIFGGPGYRLASSKYSGAFIEAGAVLKFGGLSLGAGLKSLNYSNPGKESDGTNMPKSDTVVFIILAGGGAL